MANKKQRQGKIFSFGNLMKIPATLGTIQALANGVNWKAAEDDIRSELKRRIVIVGLSNTGKSTLFNKIQGRYRSDVSPVAGTTTVPVQSTFGPFVLVDTPGHLPDVQEQNARDAAVILLLIDATRGLGPDDIALFQRLEALKRPLIVAVNKIDALRGDPERIATDFAVRLGVREAIPISGKVGTNVAEELLPALIDASPEAALAIGRYLPEFRHKSAERLIRNSALISLAAGIEPIPLVDIPILLGNQIRMVLRIAAIYGEPISAQYVRELIGTIAGGLALRYVAGEAAKAVPIGGDFVSGAIAAAGTWAIGMVVLEYFEHDKQIDRRTLRQMFRDFYTRFRSYSDPKDAVRELPSRIDGDDGLS